MGEDIGIVYGEEKLLDFAREYALGGDAAAAYRTVWRVKGVEKCGAGARALLAREDVRELVEIERRKAVLAAQKRARDDLAALGGEGTEPVVLTGMYSDLDKMLHVVAGLAFGAESENVRLQAAMRYESLLQASMRRSQEEDVPEELAAFLRELELVGSD